MEKIPFKKKNLSYKDIQNYCLNEENEEIDVEGSSSNLIKFFIFVFIIIILIIILLLVILYNFIYKEDIKRSRRNKHPEIFLRLKERHKIDQYIQDCIKGVLYDKNKYKKNDNPHISIIIPIYNKEKFILRILRSIQNQSLKDIEIIFSDDASKDNSTKLIKEFQKEDERIILIEHYINKGTLVTRNDGVKISKGEYLLFLDGDDLLTNNILEKAYLKAKENNIDIVQFQTYSGDFNKSFYCSNLNRTNKIIHQPELSSLMYYENGVLHLSEIFIWGKLIKRKTFLETLKNIDEYYLNQKMTICEDGMMLFMLFRTAKSYLFINDYGLLYFNNEYSTMANLRNKNKINLATKNCFIYLEFMFNYTNNTLYEKNMAVCQFKSLLNGFKDIYLKTTEGFDYIYKVIDLYIKCKNILEDDKIFIRELKEQFKIIEQNLKL